VCTKYPRVVDEGLQHVDAEFNLLHGQFGHVGRKEARGEDHGQVSAGHQVLMTPDQVSTSGWGGYRPGSPKETYQ